MDKKYGESIVPDNLSVKALENISKALETPSACICGECPLKQDEE